MKTGFVYLLLCLAFIAFLIFSNNPPDDHHNHVGLHRRAGPRHLVIRKLSTEKHEPVAFDPIVASLERKREDRAWEREYFHDQYKRWNSSSASPPPLHPTPDLTGRRDGHTEDEQPSPRIEQEPESWDYEDYLNNEEEFNISQRIITLFPLIDTNPTDGFISLAELQNWHLQAALKQAEYRTDRQIDTYDSNHDRMISLSEYLSHVAPHQLGNDTMDTGEASWWKEQFTAADENGDGLLNYTEFNNFLHPQDSKNEKLLALLRRQDIRNYDHDHDGKLSFEEFSLGLFDLLRNYHEEDHSISFDSPEYEKRRGAEARQKFVELDKNKDGFLTEDELLPATERLHPGELFFAKQQAEYLIEQADRNKDGRLSLEEMLENPYVFYGTAYAHQDDDYLHDEFR